MDFANLGSEYDRISFYSKQNLDIIDNLNSYYKILLQHAELFYSNIKKPIASLLDEHAKFDNTTTLSKKLYELYRNFDEYTNKGKTLLGKLSKDIVDPMGLFQQNLDTIYTEGLEEFKSMAIVVCETRKNLEKIQAKYYDASKIVEEQEKNLCKTFSGKFFNNDDEINKAHYSLLKYRSQAENLSQLYLYEVSKVNKLYCENENNYKNIVDRLRMNEESRIFFLRCNMEKFSKFWEEFAVSSFDFLNRLNSTLTAIKMEGDMKEFDEKFRYITDGSRFPREEFVSYDQYKKQSESSISQVNDPSMEDEKEVEGNTNTSPKETELMMSSISDDFEIIHDSQFFTEKYQATLISGFMKQIFSEREIEVDAMGKLMDLLYNNPLFAKTFIDSILQEKKNSFIKLLNFSNLQHLANILNTISLNLDSIHSENYDLNFAIIYIAERTYFQNPGQTIYLCAILSKNIFYSTKTFWTDLIELKLSRRLEEHVNRLSNIDIIRIPQKIQLKNNQPSLADKETRDTSNLFANLGSTLKNIFNKEKENKKDKDTSKSLLLSTKIAKLIRNYETLAEHKRPILDKIATSEMGGIIKEFIPHLANFNFDVSEAIDMIMELCTKYKIIKEKINFFVTYLNSSMQSIRKWLPNQKKESELSNNIRNIKEKRNHYIITAKNPISGSVIRSTCEEKLLVLCHVVKYLPMSEYLNILTLNTFINYRISGIIFKLMLTKPDLQMKTRLGIWKSILGTSKLVKRYNYHKILQALNERKSKEAKATHVSHDIIDLDVQRTFFENNVDQSRTAITSILKGIALANPQINYCQGMNYIASFLYNLSQNEEETFYIMLGLMENTEFSVIFMEDLQKLKTFFFIFERLLSLLVPELHSYFKTNSVFVNYFCAPWFLTLFSNACPYLSNLEIPKVIIQIWDNFLLKGWKALMIAGLCLLKCYESSLLQMKYEDLLHFLINDLIKSGFFQNNNFGNFITIAKSFKFNSKLISNLENEIIMESKIKEIEDSQKFQIQISN